MKIDEIIEKWMQEGDRLVERLRFCSEHNLLHEREFISERYNAIKDVLCDLRFNLDREEKK